MCTLLSSKNKNNTEHLWNCRSAIIIYDKGTVRETDTFYINGLKRWFQELDTNILKCSVQMTYLIMQLFIRLFG